MRLDLTKRSDYAIRAMLALTMVKGGLLSSRRIAEQMHIPPRFLPQIMGDLTRAGLVVAHPGRAGGYQLAENASQGDASAGHRGGRGGPAPADLRAARHALRRGRRMRRPRHLLRGRGGAPESPQLRHPGRRHRRWWTSRPSSTRSSAATSATPGSTFFTPNRSNRPSPGAHGERDAHLPCRLPHPGSLDDADAAGDRHREADRRASAGPAARYA